MRLLEVHELQEGKLYYCVLSKRTMIYSAGSLVSWVPGYTDNNNAIQVNGYMHYESPMNYQVTEIELEKVVPDLAKLPVEFQ